MAIKRKRVSRTRAFFTAARTRSLGSLSRARNARSAYKKQKVARTVARVNKLYSMIETKESTFRTSANVTLPHNNLHLVLASDGAALNPFRFTGQGAGDPMDLGGNRIGDQITVRGVMLRGMLENALGRARVHYRIMLLRGAKGETFDRNTVFRQCSGNKLIDMINTERFTVVASKRFTIGTSNVAPLTVGATGVPATATPAGTGARPFKMWIPGIKFGRGGNVQFESTSQTQVKFYDYRFVILAYDWYGTPQDANNVGIINEMYCKLYFKDA